MVESGEGSGEGMAAAKRAATSGRGRRVGGSRRPAGAAAARWRDVASMAAAAGSKKRASREGGERALHAPSCLAGLGRARAETIERVLRALGADRGCSGGPERGCRVARVRRVSREKEGDSSVFRNPWGARGKSGGSEARGLARVVARVTTYVTRSRDVGAGQEYAFGARSG